MFAYVKNLTLGMKNPFTCVHISRIFHYVSKGQKKERVKFDPKKHDVNIAYGVVISKSIVKHQVLLVRDSEEDLKKVVNEQENSRLRSLPCPKMLETGSAISEPLRNYTLVEEQTKVKELESKKATAQKKVTEERSSKILKKMTNNLPVQKENVQDNSVSRPNKSKANNVGARPTKKAKLHDNRLPAEPGPKPSTLNALETGSYSVESVNNSVHPHQEALGKQLQLALAELEIYRARCSELEQERQETTTLLNRLDKMEKNLQEIKAYMASAQERSESEFSELQQSKQLTTTLLQRLDEIETNLQGFVASRKVAERQFQLCNLSQLTDVSPCPEKDYEVSPHEVHMGDGEYFIHKKKLVKVEKLKGLRPRLRKLLTYMYKGNLSQWCLNKQKKHVDNQDNVKEIPNRHVMAFQAVLVEMKWKTPPNLDVEHIRREMSKALSELKSENFPMSDSDGEENIGGSVNNNVEGNVELLMQQVYVEENVFETAEQDADPLSNLHLNVPFQEVASGEDSA